MPGFGDLFYQQHAAPAVEVRLSEQQPGIPLDPSAVLRLAHSAEEYAYNRGFLTLYRLVPNPRAKGCYRLEQHPCSTPLDPTHASISTPDGIYSFVIVETKEGLDLRIGSGGHYHTADKAEFVIAAGDLHFIPDGSRGGFLREITDKSGSYNTTKKQLQQKALEAMKAMGLPIDKFCAFQETTTTLLFSAGTRGYRSPATPVNRVPAGSMAEAQGRPCTGEAPRVRQPAL